MHSQITWIDGLGNVITRKTPGMEIAYSAEHSPESRLYTAKSVLTIRPKKEHHNTTFTCQAQNTADRNYKSAKIRLYVKYAPKVSNSTIIGMQPFQRAINSLSRVARWR